ncbi:hypothetical protein DWB68_10190 [Galactobacter valiniphilus]|uniref:Uncharacterized protein n=1 Tax=Galactobacter valiniphilus TaxID=2676122 RepID=A0A399JBH4_9MICC|nr:hypothetical protein DWB68_10190 [Galactobacter valiniphilus]
MWIRWDGPNAGALVNGTGRDLLSFRVLVPGPSRVRARADWYEDKDVLRANGEVTFSRLDRRGPDPVMRVRFKLGLGPRFDWITKQISLRPPAPGIPEQDPWSLGARTRKP